MTDLIKRVKAALENATPGPWRLSSETCYSGRMSGSYYRVFDDNLNAICSEEYGAYNDGGDGNMNLIALAPDMARALVAADKLAGYVEGIIEDGCPKCGGDCSSAMPPVGFCPIREAMSDLAAFRAAVGGD